MACFIVPATEAIVTTVAEKVVKKHKGDCAFTENVSILNKMLWGGSALLAFEHVWHGEVVPFFPFLTAASNPESLAEMLHEMAVSGTSMAVLVTMVWAVVVLVKTKLTSSAKEPATEEASA